MCDPVPDIETILKAMRDVLDEFFQKCELGKKFGIPLWKVVDGQEVVPPGWVLDQEIEYFMPPNLSLSIQ